MPVSVCVNLVRELEYFVRAEGPAIVALLAPLRNDVNTSQRLTKLIDVDRGTEKFFRRPQNGTIGWGSCNLGLLKLCYSLQIKGLNVSLY
jgi:hypothetical protein